MTAPPGPHGHEQLTNASPARVYLFPSGAELEGGQARAARSPRHSAGASKRRWLVSNEATHWAWKTPVRGVRQHVLLALADRANKKTRQCSPSLSELSDMTGLGESTIRGHIRALEVDGLVKVDVTNGGRRQRSTYTLMIESTFSGTTETPQQLGGIERKTRQQRAGKKTETPQDMGGIEVETPQELAGNPPAAGGVVLRTKTRTREPGTTGAANATPGADSDALFDAPPPPPTPLDERAGKVKVAQAITKSYCAAEPMSKFVAVLGIVRRAVDSGRYPAEEINAAVLRVAEDKRPLTLETLRIELEGFSPRRRLRPAAGQHVADPSRGVYWEQ